MSIDRKIIPTSLAETGFQVVPGYRDYARTPFTVIAHTKKLLDLRLFSSLPLHPAQREYLDHDTQEKLRLAATGSRIRLPEIGETIPPYDPEACEAFDHTSVIFAFLPAQFTLPYLPMGFSRRGMLQPPTNRREFLMRLGELQAVVLAIATGEIDKSALNHLDTAALRTYAFFKVGSELPLKLPYNELKEKAEEEAERLALGGQAAKEGHEIVVRTQEEQALQRLLFGIDFSSLD